MFDPSASEHYYEFIEIYNLSDSESIDLTGWSISDGQDFDKIVSVVEAIVIPPNQFAIILDPGYFENDPIYDVLIPEAALILTIDGATFGSSGLSNSTAETITLLDQYDTPVSEYTYSLDNVPGHSDEKIELSGDNTPGNWANSFSEHGTPGFRNSVSPFGIDLAVSFNFIPDSPGPNDPVIIDVYIVNIGTEPVSDYSLIVFEDQNMDSIGVENEIIFQKINISTILMPGDSLQMQVTSDKLHSGSFLYIVHVSAVNDMNAENNKALKYLTIRFRKNSLVINEVMFRPNSGEPEWIELYNLSDMAIDLMNWKISDSRTDTRVKVTEESVFIQPNEFMILSQKTDSWFDFRVPHMILDNWSALNNNGDAVVLYDLSGATIDSIYYSGDWSIEQGISLERFDYARSSTDSANWAPCQEAGGSTPGRYNSISAKEFDLRIDNLRFTKQNAGESDVLVSVTVINAGRQGISRFTVSFYHDINSDSLLEYPEIIGIVSTNESLARFDSVIVTTEWENVPPGIQNVFAVVSCAQDQNAANDTTFRSFNESFPSQSIVINEIMYAPLPDQPEWIELFNRTDAAIDIQQWLISDSDTSSRLPIVENSLVIQPDSYLIVSQASLSSEIFPEIRAEVLVPPQFPSLYNTSDAVYLYDLNGKVIDQVSYSQFWGGGNGYSLERFNPDLSSDDSENWSSCVIIEGGTPGSKNSIFVEKLPTTASVVAVPNPFSPDNDLHDDNTMIHYNLPLKTSAINIKIYDTRGRLVRYLANNRASGSEGSIIWNGLNDDGNLCRMGIYIIFLEALNAEQGVIVSHKSTVVLAGKL